MTRPVTELDSRFSNPDAKATSWDDARQVLEAAQLFWVVTIRADGRPHLTPLVAVWHEGALYFSTGADEQKAVNLRANPHVILLTGCNSWDEGLDVSVEGEATPVTDEALLRQVAQIWAGKWDGESWLWDGHDGRFNHPGGGGGADVFRVEPAKVLAFGKGNFSHTRHKFR
jgi:general stress protein 26